MKRGAEKGTDPKAVKPFGAIDRPKSAGARCGHEPEGRRPEWRDHQTKGQTVIAGPMTRVPATATARRRAGAET
jgi:hypothetical protein